MFGPTGPCIISLVTPVAATLYGIHKLGSLTGILNLANVPGAFCRVALQALIDPAGIGNLGGTPISGTILDHLNRNWHALPAYSGLAQLVGMICILYGIGICFVPCLNPLLLFLSARFNHEPRVWAKF